MRDRVGSVLRVVLMVAAGVGLTLSLLALAGCSGSSGGGPGVEEFNVTCGGMCFDCAGVATERWVTAAVIPAREFDHCPDVTAAEPGLCYQPVAGVGNVCFSGCDGSACVVPPLPLAWHPVIQ